MNNINLDLPINSLSFGNVSIAILREFYNRGLHPNVFPLNNQVDLSSRVPDEKFNQWLVNCINKAPKESKRSDTSIKLWHLNGALNTYSSRDSRLITFHETDSLTPHEVNILKNQDKVYVTSKFTQQVFETYGIKSIYLPLGFDNHNFKQLEKRPKTEGVITFGMFGKWEPLRKSHIQILKNWVKKYGNNTKYRLNLSIENPFLKQEQVNGMLAGALEGKQYNNLNFIPFQKENAVYNQVLQNCDIALCMGVGEGRDLPCYHATAMGAWPVALRAHCYTDYLNDDNAILVSPNGKVVAHDGIFFHQGQPFNQGNFFTWSDDEFVTAMEKAEEKVKNGINQEGLKLQNLTYKDTVDVLLGG